MQLLINAIYIQVSCFWFYRQNTFFKPHAFFFNFWDRGVANVYGIISQRKKTHESNHVGGSAPFGANAFYLLTLRKLKSITIATYRLCSGYT